MRRIAIATALAAIGLASPIAAGGISKRQSGGPIGSATGLTPNSVVHPTGVFPSDVQIVQAAVDHGGIVLLKAVDTEGNPLPFNFGPATAAGGWVALTTDVTILGEAVGEAVTTIDGGYAPFRGFTPIRSAFRGIFFRAPRTTAIYIGASSGFEFIRNRISGVTGEPWFPGVLKGQGIWLGGLGVPELITGTILIEDNTIEDIQAQLGYGVALLAFEAQMRLARNRIRGAATAGIFVALHAGPALVEDNYVEPGPSRYPGSPPDIGNGIWVLEPQGGPTYIRRNQVVCVNPMADGIVLNGDTFVSAEVNAVQNSVVENNQVTMHNSVYGGISIYGLASHNYVGHNHILGDGGYALQIVGFDVIGSAAVSNAFVANNTTGFRGSIADVFFDVNAMNNTLIGRSGTVIDLGVGNLITGFTRGDAGEHLQQFRNVQAAKRALIRSLKAIEFNSMSRDLVFAR